MHPAKLCRGMDRKTPRPGHPPIIKWGGGGEMEMEEVGGGVGWMERGAQGAQRLLKTENKRKVTSLSGAIYSLQRSTIKIANGVGTNVNCDPSLCHVFLQMKVKRNPRDKLVLYKFWNDARGLFIHNRKDDVCFQWCGWYMKPFLLQDRKTCHIKVLCYV